MVTCLYVFQSRKLVGSFDIILLNSSGVMIGVTGAVLMVAFASFGLMAGVYSPVFPFLPRQLS